MADKPQFFSKEDIKILQGLINREKRQIVNAPPTLITDRWDQGEDHQAPETYVAAIPDSGIPGKDAIDDYGAYPYSEYQDDIVNSTECAIYQIVKEGSFYKLRDAGFTKLIYNLGDSTILGPGFIPVTRDKFGKWIALSANAGGNSNIWVDFEVTDWCPDLPEGTSQAVYAIVLRKSCGATVNVGDEILVHDPDLCWFSLPIELLAGLRGTAFYTENDGTMTLVCAEIPDTDACIWTVKSLCCREEVVYAY